MNFVSFYHSLVSDWNHGNAHFLRGIVTELLARGHGVQVYEPRTAGACRTWSRNTAKNPFDEFHSAYPHLKASAYDSRLGSIARRRSRRGCRASSMNGTNRALVERLGADRGDGRRRFRLLLP